MIGDRTDEHTVATPALHILGTAQDGGVPQLGCACPTCARAAADPRARRRVASVGLTLPDPDGTERRLVIDVTPDARSQLPALAVAGSGDDLRPARSLVDGVYLTHAHVGHYLGLAFLGFEVLNVSELPVHGTARMCAFLERHAPWSELVRRRHIVPTTQATDEPTLLNPDVRLTSFLVPHRAELTDTVGYLVQGPRRSVAYVPDTDPWNRWTDAARRRLSGADVVIVDATFHSAAELPDRDLSTIGHPLVTDTLDALGPLVDAGRRVVLTHLNHSNPLLDPESAAHRLVRERGFEIAREGDRIEL